MIGIRADANDVVATGHIMRCITIAKQLKKRGETVCFFIADEYAVPMLEQAGMNYVCLYTQWNQMEAELPVLLKELDKAGCEKVLVDSYQSTPAYIAALKETYKIIYIDDMFEKVYPAHMIINYNAYHIQFPYKETYKKDVKLLLGTTYVPLREEFSSGRYKQACMNREAKINVLLSCGGGDVYNALAGILEEAITRDYFKDVVFHTIVGRFNKNANELESLSGKWPQIQLYYDVSHMAELMNQCQIAVSAAGTVLFELCAMEVPAVFFVCADNQKYDSDFFAQNGVMLFAGDIRTNPKECISNICDGIEKLKKNGKLQKDMKKKQQAVTDGNGAARIAEEILNL